MSLTKASLLTTAGILGVGMPITVGTYYQTHIKVWDEIKDDAFPNDSSSDVWSKLKTKIPENTSHQELKSIKDNNEDQLKNWCFKKYNETYKIFGLYKLERQLVDEIKTVCTLKIKDQMQENNKLKVEGEESKADFEKLIKELKSHSDQSILLDNVLEDLKNKSEDTNTLKDWEKLRDWCKEAYERGYQGERSNRWMLVNKFCKKKG